MQGASLLPGNADPLIAAALVQTREALGQPLGDPPIALRLPRGFRDAAADGLPTPDSTLRLDDYSPDVRQVNLLGELLRHVHLSVDPSRPRITLHHLDFRYSHALAPDAITAHRIYSVSRPPASVFAGRQLDLVHRWAELRNERLPEILTQLAVPLPYWAAILDLNPSSYPHTLELLSLGLALAYQINQPSKHLLACPRPVDYSPSIQPVIQAGRFCSFPGGHALEGFLVARLLAMLAGPAAAANPSGLGQLDTQLQRLAARIANNRVVAGVHFPIDAIPGRMAGECLAEYLRFRCLPGAPAWVPRDFDGAGLKDGDETLAKGFDRSEALGADTAAAQAQLAPYFRSNGVLPSGLPADASGTATGPSTRPSLMLAWLWQHASDEWAA